MDKTDSRQKIIIFVTFLLMLAFENSILILKPNDRIFAFGVVIVGRWVFGVILLVLVVEIARLGFRIFFRWLKH
ncbi:MAG: hypothetical protein WCG31_10235 [Deltaproteobacteria bacterium]